MWKKLSILLLVIAVMVPVVNGGSGFESVPGFAYNVSTGSITQVNDVFYNHWTVVPSNNTIYFDLAGQILHPVIFTVNPYGNGTLTITLFGPQPLIQHGTPATFAYASGRETITYISASGMNNPLILIYNQAITSESQKVLFIDDFLYTNPELESSWAMDQYQNPGQNSGQFTSSGYLVMKAGSSSTETVHVTNPMYQPTIYSTGNAVKRKMTVAMIPFAKTEAGTANVKAGLVPLISDTCCSPYPGVTPNGTPWIDTAASCSVPTVQDTGGAAYLAIDNAGVVFDVTCDSVGNRRISTLETGLNPSLYTVFTIETFGIFCSNCTNNAFSGSSWIWFRVYQRDSSGNVMASTDKSQNITNVIAPLFQTTFAMISQSNFNAGSTGQTSKIDFLSVQNYGSPVCLVVPSGTLCSNFPIVPNNFGQGVISDIAWLSNQIGFGDPQVGAIIIFFILSGAFCFIPLIFTRNYLIAGEGELVVIGFFTFAGFLPEWVIIIPILGGAVLMVMLIRKMVSGYSFGGGE